MPIRVRLRGLERNSVLAEKIDRHIGKRFSFFDRHQKNLVTGVGVVLGQDSDVGDENEPEVAATDWLFIDRVPALRSQEKKAALGAAIGWLAQMLGKIECGIIRLPLVLQRDALALGRNPGNVFFVEVVWNLEERAFEFSLGLADQMINLRCGNAAYFKFQRAQP